MTNIVPFAPKPADTDTRAVWRCVCGCLTHFVRADHEIECASCGNIAADAGDWRRRPDAPSAAAEVDQTDVVVKDLGDAATAIRRVLRNLNPDDMVCLVVIRDDGTISTWSGRTETEKQKDWLRDRLAAASGMMGL